MELDFIIDPDAVPLKGNAVIPQTLCDGENYGLPELYRQQNFQLR